MSNGANHRSGERKPIFVRQRNECSLDESSVLDNHQAQIYVHNHFIVPQHEAHKFVDRSDSYLDKENRRTNNCRGQSQSKQGGLHNRTNTLQESLQESESEVSFLKKKLIETHSKLIHELNVSKQIEDQYHELKAAYQSVASELNSFKSNQSAAVQEELKQLQKHNQSLTASLKQLNKQNDLNSKQKEDLLLKVESLQQTNKELRQTIESLQSNQSKKDKEFGEKEDLCEIWRKKYEKATEEFQKLEQTYYKEQQRLNQLELSESDTLQKLKNEKDTNSQLLSDIINLQMETKTLQHKLEAADESKKVLQNKVFTIESNTKNSSHKREETEHQVQQLKAEYNAVSVLLKQRDKEVQQLKAHLIQLCVEQKKKKEQSMVNIKSFVAKLEAADKIKEGNEAKKSPHCNPEAFFKKYVQNKGLSSSSSQRNINTIQNQEDAEQLTGKEVFESNKTCSPSAKVNALPKNGGLLKNGQLKSYKQEKQQYLSMLSEVGDLETEIYQLNTEKGHILDELDKIEATKVKNNQMINRRRQLESILLSNDRRVNEIRQELRSIKFL